MKLTKPISNVRLLTLVLHKELILPNQANNIHQQEKLEHKISSIFANLSYMMYILIVFFNIQILKDNFKIDFRQVAPITRHKRSYSDPFKYISEQKDQKKYRILNEPLSPSTISSSRVSQSASKVFDQFTFPNE